MRLLASGNRRRLPAPMPRQPSPEPSLAAACRTPCTSSIEQRPRSCSTRCAAPATCALAASLRCPLGVEGALGATPPAACWRSPPSSGACPLPPTPSIITADQLHRLHAGRHAGHAQAGPGHQSSAPVPAPLPRPLHRAAGVPVSPCLAGSCWAPGHPLLPHPLHSAAGAPVSPCLPGSCWAPTIPAEGGPGLADRSALPALRMRRHDPSDPAAPLKLCRQEVGAAASLGAARAATLVPMPGSNNLLAHGRPAGRQRASLVDPRP